MNDNKIDFNKYHYAINENGKLVKVYKKLNGKELVIPVGGRLTESKRESENIWLY